MARGTDFRGHTSVTIAIIRPVGDLNSYYLIIWGKHTFSFKIYLISSYAFVSFDGDMN